jgi:uncharacterized alkaline shock family protein YloU
MAGNESGADMTPPSERVVAEPVIASIAAEAAQATPGVLRLASGVSGLVAQLRRQTRARWSGLDPAPGTGVTVRRDEPEPGDISARVDLVVSGDRTAVRVATAVQRAVRDAVAENTGVVMKSIEVSIVDIELS